MFKKTIVCILAAVCTAFAFVFAACDRNDNPDPPNEWGDVLIVYFSKTGTTRAVAETIQNYLELSDDDVFEVVRKDPYPDAYQPTTEEARDELDANARPELAEYIPQEKFAEYETIIFGYPIWWHQAPMPMFSFLEHYDLTDKNIVTFCTAATSPINETTAMIRSNADGANVYEGKKFTRRASTEVRNWLTELKLLDN